MAGPSASAVRLYADQEGLMSTSRPKTRAQAKAAQPPARRPKGGKRGHLAASAWAIARHSPAGSCCGAIAFFVAYATIDIPQPNDLADAQASIIYYADGKTEMDRSARSTASRCPCRRCPSPCRRHTWPRRTATSTRTPASRPSGIARAVWVGAARRQTQGGSTITQQYVKNYFLTQDQTLTRKAQGDHHLHQDRQAEVQGPDPRELPQHHLLRPRRVRHPDRVARPTSARTSPSSPPPRARCSPRSSAGRRFYDPGLGAEQKANAEARWNYVLDGMVEAGLADARPSAAKATFPQGRPTYKPRQGRRAAPTATSSTRSRTS